MKAPVQLNSVTRAYFEALSQGGDDDTSKWMRALESSDRADHAARWLSDANPSWNSMLRDTIAPTMLQAGIRNNVVPSEARGVLNIRLLPGNLVDPVLSKLQQLVNDPQVHFEIEPGAGENAPSSSLTSDLYNTISRVAAQQFAGAKVVPYMSTGATDSMPLRLRNVQAYGLLPFPLTEDDLSRFHADNERIPIDSFRKGIEFLVRHRERFCSRKIEQTGMQHRRAKIVCTLGPASSSAQMIDGLVDAGMDVARLNFSHGTHAEHARSVVLVRRASAKYQKPIAVLADLQGPKIRTGALERGLPVRLRFGQRFVITTKRYIGTAQGVSTTFRGTARGGAQRRSDSTERRRDCLARALGARARCSLPGRKWRRSREHQGINLPGTKLKIPSLTRKDREDLAFALDLAADYVALSFVRTAADVRAAKTAIARAGKTYR